MPEKAIITYKINYAFGCFGNTDKWDGIYFGNNFRSKKTGHNNPKKLTDIYNLIIKIDNIYIFFKYKLLCKSQ